MADATPQIGPNFRDVVVKGGALRLSDIASRDTTDYAEILVGDGHHPADTDGTPALR